MTKLLGKRAKNFKLNSTSGKLFELKKINLNILFYISIQKMTLLVVLWKPKTLIYFCQNLKN